MQFIFIDETGNSGRDLTNAEQPFHILVGVVIPHMALAQVQQQMFEIAKEYYRDDFEKADFEFKGFDLFKGHHLNKDKKVQERIAVAEKIFGIVKSSDFKVIATCIDKQKLHDKYKDPAHPHHLAFRFMIEAFEKHLLELDKWGLMVCDEIKEHEQSLIEDLETVKRQGSSVSILDSVHYVKSHNSWSIQLSDVVTYFIGRYVKSQTKQELTRSDEQIKNMVEGSLKNYEIKTFP